MKYLALGILILLLSSCSPLPPGHIFYIETDNPYECRILLDFPVSGEWEKQLIYEKVERLLR